ncbi:venom serine carboxypeptidase [Folsomia candida]|uniref:Venom serine carboxypeptidase n=1 Tax=Folsomia candida TaxID=158441 RepID=A0A226CZX6_FOLCA|nr:venom serine carboxypeptidase [Folsomia candida]OXA38037.1 Venom serine carboxypeptidase [Folsomia candida]
MSFSSKIRVSILILVLKWVSLVTSSADPLLLTPLLSAGRVEDARKLALVKLRNVTSGSSVGDTLPVEVISYSGLLTVDDACHSTIFFWFFPAMYDAPTAPVILWHGGGPGSSGLSALFSQHGPFSLGDDGTLHLRHMPWALARSVLYVDSPVGTGFSRHDDRPECYVRTTTKTAKHMVTAMSQFFIMFPEYGKNDFFIFSGSYGGKFVPAIAYEIHTQNRNSVTINLKGFCIASGFSDPISQIDYGAVYLAQGLIDAGEFDNFHQQETAAKANINQGNWSAAFDIIEPLIIGVDEAPSRLTNLTGITFPYNMAKDWVSNPPELRRHVAFLNRPDIQEAIHTGSLNYSTSSSIVYSNFKQDIYQSVKPIFEELLDSGLYRVLIIGNQLDLIVPHASLTSFLNGLNWKKGSEWRGSRSKILGGQGQRKVALGYVRQVDELTYLFLRNSGHLWILDQPQVAFEVMTKFTSGGNL